jgi:hypothetical protein
MSVIIEIKREYGETLNAIIEMKRKNMEKRSKELPE